MAGAADLIAQALQARGVASVSANKQAEVAQTAETKKTQLGGLPTPDQLYAIGAARQHPGDLAGIQDPVQRDMVIMTPMQLIQKYGAGAAQMLSGQSLGEGAYIADRTAPRSMANVVGDTASSVALGAANTVAGIGALGLGAVSPELGTGAAHLIQKGNDWAQDHQSAGLNIHRRANAAVNALDEADNTVKYAEDKKTDGEFVAGLKRIGRDAMSNVKNAVQDSTILSDGLANAGGSLLIGGPLGKGIAAGGEALAARLAVGAAGPSRAAALIANTARQAAMPIAIGGMEAGGAYQQTAEQALQEGASPDQANKAALTAAAITAPLAVASGTLVAPFEKAPFRPGSAGSLVSNMLKEATEEGIQSGVGQTAQNVGIKTFVDPNQDLTEGVGAQVGQGALYGAGSAGVVAAPGAAVHSVVGAGKAAVGAAASLGDARTAKVTAEQTQAATDTQNQAVASVPELHDALQSVVATKGGEQAPQMAEYLTNLFSKAQFDPTEAANEAPVVQNAVQGATDRFSALRNVAQAISDPATPNPEKVQLASYLRQQNGQYQDLLRGDLPQAIHQIEDEHPMLPKLREFEDVVMGLDQHPAIKAAMQKAQEAVSDPEQAKDLIKNLDQPTADAVLEHAVQAPDQIDQRLLEVVRQHAESGKIQLTPEQKQTLVAASTLVRTNAERIKSLESLGLSNSDQVSHQIQSQDAVGDPNQHPVQSATAKGRTIVQSALSNNSGDRDLAVAQLRDLSLFTQHLQNKVEALNASYTQRVDGKPGVQVSYQALNPDRAMGEASWYNAPKPLTVHATREGSIKNAQSIALDAKAVRELTNGIATAFPDIAKAAGVQSVAPISLELDPKLEKKAADIVQAHLTAKQASTEPEVKSHNKAGEAQSTNVSQSSESQSNTAQPEVKPTQEPAPAPETTKGETKAKAEQPSVEKPVEQSAGVGGVVAEAQDRGRDQAPTEGVDGESFSNLVGSREGSRKSRFTKAFSFPEKARTRLAGKADEAVKFVYEAFGSQSAMVRALGGAKLKKALNDDTAKAYQSLIATAPDIEKVLSQRLGAFLKDRVAKGGPTFGELLLSDAEKDLDPRRMVRGKALNLVTQNADGSFEYHPELLQSAILAGLQWWVNTGGRPNKTMDDDDIAKMFGVSLDQVNDTLRAIANQTTSVDQVVQDLSRLITQFWGAKASNTEALGYVQGISEAMAKELLTGMSHKSVELINLGQETIDTLTGPKTLNLVQLKDSKANIDALKKLQSFPDAIQTVANIDTPPKRFVGAPPSEVAPTQMKNASVLNTAEQRTMIENEQGVPHLLNSHVLGFYKALGKPLVSLLFANGDRKGKPLNKNDEASQKGQNLAVEGAFDEFEGLVSEAQAYADNQGVDLHEVPIHYAYNVSKVGRLQMLGAYNPQGSKLMREVVLPTRATLDLTDNDQLGAFMLAVGQAWGVKVHKQSLAATIEEVRDLAAKKFAPALEALQAHLEGHPLGQDDILDIKAAMGGDLSPAAVHAALEYLRFQGSSEAEKKAFTTHLYVEADGVTDGPINALVHLATGRFDQNWTMLVAKGGLFLGSKGLSMNDYASDPTNQEAKRDLYQYATDMLKQHLAQAEADWPPAIKAHSEKLRQLMAHLLTKDIQLDGEGNLTIGRGILKNPLTVTIYGSGTNGIVNKVVGAITEKFYEELSKAAQGESEIADEVRNLMHELTTKVIFRNEAGQVVWDRTAKTQMPKDTSDTEYTLTKAQRENLGRNVKDMFVQPMVDAIGETMSSTEAGRKALQKAIQVQSLFLQEEFKQRVEAKLEDKAKADPSFNKSDFLSQAELDEIRKDLEKYAPIIGSEDQTFNPAGSEDAVIRTKEDGKPAQLPLSATLDGELRTDAHVRGFADAGVGGIPYTVIGFGDGTMMQKLSVMLGKAAKLLIFDGVHLPLDQLANNEKVNEAVHQAWQTNPLTHVNETFQKFMNSTGKISDAQLLSMAPAFFSPDQIAEGEATAVEIAERLAQLKTDMQRYALESDARHWALSQVDMSVDHMAASARPFQAEGKFSLEGLEPAEIVAKLNELYEQRLTELLKENQDLKVSAAELDRHDRYGAEPAKAVEPIKAPRSLSLVQLQKTLNRIGDAEHRNLLKEAIRELRKQGADWKIVYDEPTSQNGLLVHGYTDFQSREIHLHSESPETLTHEIIHAAVTGKILQAYLDPKSASPEVLAAVENLKVLGEQWLSLDPSTMEPKVREAYEQATAAMKREQANANRSKAENQAAALDEFLAWTLSNQKLIKQAQQTKVENVFARITKQALQALKTLIWGRQNGPMVPNSMYAALRFNASVLINSGPTLQAQAQLNARYQSTEYGSNQRLSDLIQSWNEKLGLQLKDQPGDLAKRGATAEFLEKVSAPVAKAFIEAGFSMNMQQQQAFNLLVATFATQAKLDQSALARVQELYTHATKTLTPADFMADPESQDPNDAHLADRKLSALTGTLDGKSIVATDAQGRSSLVPAFLALVMVHDGFRDVLAKLPSPKGEKLANDHLDNMLTNAGNGLMDLMAQTLAGDRGKANVQEAIDALTDTLTRSVQAQNDFISQAVDPLGRVINTANDFGVKVVQGGTKKAIQGIDTLKGKTSNKIAQGALDVARSVVSIVNIDEAPRAAEGVISLINQGKVWRPLHELISDVIGEVKSNAPVAELAKQVRSQVSQVRQQFRESLPRLIEERFTKAPTAEQWTHLFKGLAKTDLAALHATMSTKQILELLAKPREVKKLIGQLEQSAQAESGPHWIQIKDKALGLADYMTTGKVDQHLLRNAEAVAKLAGVKGVKDWNPSAKLVSTMDRLISLYALEKVSPEVRETLSFLAQSEAAGIEFTLSYLVGQRTDEQSKVSTAKARMNHYKGFIPSEPQKGVQLLVADDTDKARLLSLGYKRVADYQGSPHDIGSAKMGYYFSPVSAKSPFSQGVMQNIRHTASGVDPVTGHSYGVQTAGRIVDPRAVRAIRNGGQIAQAYKGEHLMPIFNGSGEIIAYERSLNPNQEALLNRNTHLAQMIGVWRGRQAEESMASEFNTKLIDKLYSAWINDKKAGRESEYVDLFDPKLRKTDPVTADAVSLFTPETLELIKNTFGEGDGFRVRKDMLNDAIGYRAASVGDIWTGTTRIDPKAADTAKRAIIGAFGLDSYRYLVQGERLIQNLVIEAKQTIVVRSVIVPVSNMIGNVYQMASRGIGLTRIAKSMPSKLAEVNAYVQRRVRQIEVEAELRAAEGDPAKTVRLKTELQTIEDANSRMSIWPLIQAGEFSGISQTGALEKEDVDLYSGKLTEFLEKKVDQLPHGLRSFARYGLITADTPLYQGLQRAMEYGDFLAKAITYDHLVEEKKVDPKEAIAQVREEFVNYDRLRGRGRAYLESMGLMWFLNYKIRIAKIAVSTLRHNPLHALLAGLVPSPPLVGNVGLPLADNIFTVGFDGKLGNMLGPHMGLNAHNLNPWVNFFEG